jgi:regulator of RNase E activity RraA
MIHSSERAAALTARLQGCYTGAVHDVLRMTGHERIALPPAIKAIAPGTRLAGPVWTVSGHIDRTKTRHECLLGWCTLLSKAPAGHVVVCQPHNHEIALMGELSARTLQARGVLGYVVDGGSRDTDLVLEHRFPVFCAFLTPTDIVERWVPDRFGEPVTIGDVTIAPGDYLLGDRDGVVVIPRDAAEDVVTRTEEVVATESEMRSALIGGMDPVEAYNRFGKF